VGDVDRLAVRPQVLVDSLESLNAARFSPESPCSVALGRQSTQRNLNYYCKGSIITPATALPIAAISLAPEGTVKSVSEAVPSLGQYNSYT